MPRRVGMIVAVSPERVIGVGGKIPWHYPGDFKRFKRVTMGGTLIMGRRTWESIGRALPGRRNVVVTSNPDRIDSPEVECFPTLPEALESCEGDVWLIGGAAIYREGLEIADFIDMTFVPDRIEARGAVVFPEIDDSIWQRGELEPIEGEPALQHAVFTRRG